MKNRTLKAVLQERAAGKLGRLLVLTGARQSGKTTLAKEAFPDLPYISLEDPALRPAYSRMSAAEWVERYPRAVVDEVQKAPTVVETIKAAYDATDEVRYVLLGSSQILLLSRVKESLAGRASILELWPLTLTEMATSSWNDPVRPSRLLSWLEAGCREEGLLLGLPAASRAFARDSTLFEGFLQLGGMPAIHDPELTEGDRETWLHDYQRTYLERDVADLAAVRDLEPFVLAQKAIATRSGKAINFSDLARASTISPETARRFMRYLELSYQVILLPPFFRNREKRLSRMPKVHFLDPGVMRSVTRRRGEPTGEEFESAVIAELYKQVRNASLRADFSHLRTYDGREVDLLIELDQGFVAVEIKASARVAGSDARSLRNLGPFLDRPLLGSLLLSNDRDARKLDGGVIAAPTAWALGAAD